MNGPLLNVTGEPIKKQAPPLKILRPVRFFTEQHQRWLRELVKVQWDGTKLHHIVQLAYAGAVTTFEAPGLGLILIQPVDHPQGRELFLYGIAGRGMMEQDELILDDLRTIAKVLECNMIGGEGIPKGWMRYGPTKGFKPVAVRYVMELNDGR
jgi:hypothetical protein